MKYLWAFVVFCLSATFAFSQIPNPGFESWNDESPLGWNGDSCCVHQVPESTEGNYALKVASEQMTIEGFAPGHAVSDTIEITSFPLQFTADVRIDSIRTEGSCAIQIKGIFDHQTEVLAYWEDSVEYNLYQEINLELNPEENPEQIQIILSGKSKNTGLLFVGYGSMLVDNLRLEKSTDIDSSPGIPGKLIVYPNPAQDNLRFQGLDPVNGLLYNMDGQLVRKSKLKTGGTFDVSGLQSGIYILQLLTSSGEVLSRKVLIE